MARGVGRSIIVEDDEDRMFFLKLLGRSIDDCDVVLHAWCLMDNHYHLLAEADLSDLAAMMKKLNSLYALYFNRRHDRVGHLFQGRFRSEPIETDEYFLTVLRYIHQNPVRGHLSDTCDYAWSSYRGYVDAPRLVDNKLAVSMLGGEQGFREFHCIFNDSDPCIDIDRVRTTFTIEQAILAARQTLQDVRIEEVSRLDRKRRDEAIRTLKAAHLSVRQIERLTTDKAPSTPKQQKANQ